MPYGGIRTLLDRVVVGVFALVISLLVANCRGGIGGTGNGGGDPAPGLQQLGFQFTHIPAKLSATLPVALVHKGSNEVTTTMSPQRALAEKFVEIALAKLELIQVQLYLEAGWGSIASYCNFTRQSSLCDLHEIPIRFVYTQKMADWEFDQRQSILEEANGANDTLTADAVNAIRTLVNAKVDTTIKLDVSAVRFNKDVDLQYRAEVNGLPGNSDVFYEINWNVELNQVQVVIVDLVSGSERLLKSIYYLPDETQEEAYHVVAGDEKNGTKNGLSFNLHAIPGKSEKHLQSQLTDSVRGEGKTEVYTLGQIGERGSFLVSESSVFKAGDAAKFSLQREHLDLAENEYAMAECVDQSNETACEEAGAWSIVSGADDPVNLDLYTPQAELQAINEKARLYDISIRNVTAGAEAFILIRRENASISFTVDGVRIQVPGLPTLVVSSEGIKFDSDQELENELSLIGAEFLCRIVKANRDGSLDMRSFCAGSPSEFRDALVLTESYSESGFELQWQAHASVEVSEVAD